MQNLKMLDTQELNVWEMGELNGGSPSQSKIDGMYGLFNSSFVRVENMFEGVCERPIIMNGVLV